MPSEKEIKVSVIVPVYNCEKYLRRCLESIINQTLKNIEIICINDGSKDKSLKILQDYKKKDNRIIIIDQENSGVSVCRNIGIETANGEFIGFIDSDDWVDLDFFEKLYNAATENNCDIAAAEIIRLHKFNKKFHLKFQKQEITRDFETKLRLCDVPDKSYACNKIYKLDKLKKFNLKFKPKMIYEDVIFTPQVLNKLEKLITVPGTRYYYWRSSNSLVTQRTRQAQEDSFWAHKWADEYLLENNIDLDKYATKTKRYKISGMTIYKVQTRNNNTKHILFNIISWQTKRNR